MTPEQIDQVEGKAKAAFLYMTRCIVHEYACARVAQGATAEQVAAEFREQMPALLETFTARIGEIRPLILQASLGLHGPETLRPPTNSMKGDRK